MQSPESESARASAGSGKGDAAGSGITQDFAQFGRALKEVFAAQLPLLAAELGLAKSAVVWMLAAALSLVVLGVGVAFSVLALAGVALAKWFGSWLWALGALALLQVLLMLLAILVIRRCMRWMSLPQTRDQWRSIFNEAKVRMKRESAKAKADAKAKAAIKAAAGSE